MFLEFLLEFNKILDINCEKLQNVIANDDSWGFWCQNLHYNELIHRANTSMMVLLKRAGGPKGPQPFAGARRMGA